MVSLKKIYAPRVRSMDISDYSYSPEYYTLYPGKIEGTDYRPHLNVGSYYTTRRTTSHVEYLIRMFLGGSLALLSLFIEVLIILCMI